jgi:uncharacterized protein YkwD
VPLSLSCTAATAPPPDAGTPAAPDAGASAAPDAGAASNLADCVDVINFYRTKVTANNPTPPPPLARSSTIETYAAAGAEADSMSGQPHGHFIATQGGNVAFGENEIPNWPLASYGSIATILDDGMRMMFDEGPTGGHYKNIVNPQYTQVGCGIFTTAAGGVWVTTDFR